MQAQDPHLSPCLTPVCTSTLVIMQGMHELCQPERVFQDPRKEEGLIESQFIWGEEKEVEEEDEQEQNVEKEEEDQQPQQVEGGGASRERHCGFVFQKVSPLVKKRSFRWYGFFFFKYGQPILFRLFKERVAVDIVH